MVAGYGASVGGCHSRLLGCNFYIWRDFHQVFDIVEGIGQPGGERSGDVVAKQVADEVNHRVKRHEQERDIEQGKDKEQGGHD